MDKLCECGCGNIVKKGNRFIVGHNQTGKKLSKEHVEKLSTLNKESWKDPLIKEKRISNIKKAKNTPEGKQKILKAGKLGGEIIKKKWENDKIFSDHMTEECRKGGFKAWNNEDTKQHLLEVRKIQWTPLARNKMSISSKKRWENPEEREKDRLRSIERFKKPGVKEHQSKVISQAHIDGKLNNHGKFKTGYIQTETCGEVFHQSSYEKRFILILEYFFKNDWKRCDLKFKYFDGESFRYYVPDYIINSKNVFFEVKGWFKTEDKIKVEDSSRRNNIRIYLIFEEDLKFLEDLIKNQTKEFPFNKIQLISKK